MNSKDEQLLKQPTTTWYRVSKYLYSPLRVKLVEVVKETAKQVWIKDSWLGKPRISREAKQNSMSIVFDSLKKAIEYYIERQKKEIRKLEDDLVKHKRHLEDARRQLEDAKLEDAK